MFSLCQSDGLLLRCPLQHGGHGQVARAQVLPQAEVKREAAVLQLEVRHEVADPAQVVGGGAAGLGQGQDLLLRGALNTSVGEI